MFQYQSLSDPYYYQSYYRYGWDYDDRLYYRRRPWYGYRYYPYGYDHYDYLRYRY